MNQLSSKSKITRKNPVNFNSKDVEIAVLNQYFL